MSMELGPYTNFHELNLDWFLNEFNKVLAEWADMNKRFSDLNAAFIDLRNYVQDYFKNLDVQEEIDKKLDSMAKDGSLYAIIRKYTDPIVDEQNSKITVLENRMNTFTSLPEGSTSGDAELIDIRVPANGFNGNVAYPNAGDAVRGQVSALKEDLKNYVKSLPIEIYYDSIPAPYNDFNTMPDNTRIGALGGAWTKSNVSNAPDAPGLDLYTGVIETIKLADNVKIQRLYSDYTFGGTGSVYYRFLYGESWLKWVEEVTSDNVDNFVKASVPTYKNNYFSSILESFDNITCVGDSLTYSQVYLTQTNTGGLRQAIKPYPKVLEHITGVPTDFTIAIPGANAQYIWEHFNQQFTHKKNQIVIIYLGTNGGLTDTVDTDVPNNTDINTWATTQTGYYARIINAYKNVNARVILVKCYYGGDVQTTNNAIESLAERFGCGVVDEIDLGESYRLLPSGEIATSMAAYHYNDIGYSAFAYALVNEISHMPTKWMKFCLPQIENE